MASAAAQQVKLGFYVAAGFAFFSLVLLIISFLVLRAMGSR